MDGQSSGIGLNPLFLTENPKEFVPRKNPTTGKSTKERHPLLRSRQFCHHFDDLLSIAPLPLFRMPPHLTAIPQACMKTGEPTMGGVPA